MQIEKNTVPSEGQLKKEEYIRIYEKENATLKILFVGNSITRHAPSKKLGWYKDCGMAASSVENDYVHILVKMLEQNNEISYCICQASEWETNYKNIGDDIEMYDKARNFDADIIIMRVIENCRYDAFEEESFEREYERLIDYLNTKNRARIVLTTSFWEHKGDEIIRKIGRKRGCYTVFLGDLGENDDMKAVGEYENGGVACHPGDLGMKTIAERIYNAINKKGD